MPWSCSASGGRNSTFTSCTTCRVKVWSSSSGQLSWRSRSRNRGRPIFRAKHCFNAFTEASAISSLSNKPIDSPVTAETTSSMGLREGTSNQKAWRSLVTCWNILNQKMLRIRHLRNIIYLRNTKSSPASHHSRAAAWWKIVCAGTRGLQNFKNFFSSFKKMHLSCFVCICTTCFCPTIPNSALSPKQRWWTSSLQSTVPSHVCDIFFPVMLMEETRHHLMCMTRPENRPKPKRKSSLPTIHFSGANCSFWGRVLAFSRFFSPGIFESWDAFCCAVATAFSWQRIMPLGQRQIRQLWWLWLAKLLEIAWHLPTESYYSKL